MSRARLLLITEEGSVSQEFNLYEPNTVIGRSPQANVVISDEDISRSHAQIVSTPQGFFVSDLGSTNGTFLNGAAIKAKQLIQLQSNDQVNIGNVSLMFQVVPDTFPSPPPVDQNEAQMEEAFLSHSRQANSSMNLQIGEVETQVDESMQPTPSQYPLQNSNTQPSQVQPTYIPPSPTGNPVDVPLPAAMEFNTNQDIGALNNPFPSNSPAQSLSPEELALAQEIFGESLKKKDTNTSKNSASKSPVKWASWDKMNFFEKKISSAKNTDTPTQTSSKELSEEELFNQVLGNANVSGSSLAEISEQAYQNQNAASPIDFEDGSFNENHEIRNVLNSIPSSNIPSPVPAEKLVANDNASYYYPTAAEAYPGSQSGNAFPLNYSFDEDSQQNFGQNLGQNSGQQIQHSNKDPFEALQYKDEDSLLSKFIQNGQTLEESNAINGISEEIQGSSVLSEQELKEKLKISHKEVKPDIKEIIKKQALPIGLIAGAVVLAVFLYFKNSGVFG